MGDAICLVLGGNEAKLAGRFNIGRVRGHVWTLRRCVEIPRNDQRLC